MPELPDVETFKRYLDSRALQQRIEAVRVQDPRILRATSSPQRLARALRGRHLTRRRRHGKLLFVKLDGRAGWLMFHFGMTAFLKYFRDKREEPAHSRLRLDFINGTHLAFDCQRLFGTVMLIGNVETFLGSRHVGPDALDLDWKPFHDDLTATRQSLKSVLMDQSRIAGIGNVYADEILFHAGIHPHAKGQELREKAWRTLYRTARHVLRRAIAAHADPYRLPRSWLVPRRKSETSCPRCSGKIHRIGTGGRSTYFCPRCQRKGA